MRQKSLFEEAKVRVCRYRHTQHVYRTHNVVETWFWTLKKEHESSRTHGSEKKSAPEEVALTYPVPLKELEVGPDLQYEAL